MCPDTKLIGTHLLKLVGRLLLESYKNMLVKRSLTGSYLNLQNYTS